jgi:Pyruvate/2-oxoacid:ferredoxin oxidoreductase delta subunit
MGHVHARKIYRDLQKRLDRWVVGAPETKSLFEILKICFTEEEARIASLMPMKFARISELSRRTGIEERKLDEKLEAMAEKGLILDLKDEVGNTVYVLSPTVVGFFEFSLMRVRDDISQKELAAHLNHYLFEEPGDIFLREAGRGPTMLFRTLFHEDLPGEEDFVEVLDYERASEIIRSSGRWAQGLCYCRHKAKHMGRACEYPLDICTSLGNAADFIIRRNLGREVSGEESMDTLVRAREMGLVQMADNVRNNVSFICHCCKCCCGILTGFRRLRPTGGLYTSPFEPELDECKCTGCGKCVAACPVDVITLKARTKEANSGENTEGKRKRSIASIDTRFCLGCGVCVRTCPNEALRFRKREKRFIPPESTYERIITMAIERGKLQHLIFDDFTKVTHRMLNVMLGIVLRLPPVKQTLLQDTVRSRFIGWLLDHS